jgi:hypothetical protein
MQAWQQSDATLIVEVLARLDEHVLESESALFAVKRYSRTRMAKKKRK